jgi:hypothetical protein
VASALILLSGHAVAMGSGPHPNVAYGIPTVPAAASSAGVSADFVGLTLALLLLGTVIGVLRAFSRRRDP